MNTALASEQPWASHAQQRAWERYNVALSVSDLAGIRDMVAAGAANPIRREKNDDLFAVVWKGVTFAVVVKELRYIVTFLPPQVLDTRKPPKRKRPSSHDNRPMRKERRETDKGRIRRAYGEG